MTVKAATPKLGICTIIVQMTEQHSPMFLNVLYILNKRERLSCTLQIVETIRQGLSEKETQNYHCMALCAY
jgi:hypothetical protein